MPRLLLASLPALNKNVLGGEEPYFAPVKKITGQHLTASAKPWTVPHSVLHI
jgi:hypothetical protein